jgi:hypothetical protein
VLDREATRQLLALLAVVPLIYLSAQFKIVDALIPGSVGIFEGIADDVSTSNFSSPAIGLVSFSISLNSSFSLDIMFFAATSVNNTQ